MANIDNITNALAAQLERKNAEIADAKARLQELQDEAEGIQTQMRDAVPKLLLSVTETAEATGMSRTKVYELVASGTLPSVRIVGSIRVPVDALRKWIDDQTVTRIEAERPSLRAVSRR